MFFNLFSPLGSLLLRNVNKTYARVTFSIPNVSLLNFASHHPISTVNILFTNAIYPRRKTSSEIDNPVSDNGLNKSKAKLVLELNLKSPDHAVPFYKLPTKTLLQIYKTTKADKKNGFCENRLYYIADRIKCSPSQLSKCIAKRTFIYSLSFVWLEKSLNVLLEMDVAGERIMRDLWVLKYHHETIRERLQRVRDMGVETLYPWMVRCSEDILKRYIEIFQETKNILGDSESTLMYLASRLKTSPDVVNEICTKIPALKTIRVTKVKQFLDFLIQEGFDVEHIASKPRVLTASQKTIQNRLEKLRELGLQEINLNVLCRSKKDFKKFCESFESSASER